MTDRTSSEPGDPTAPAEQTAPSDPPAPLLVLRDGLPTVIDTDDGLRAYSAALAAGSGPVAIDAERASGYRYGNRAYLVQLRRAGAGTGLVDPTAVTSLAPLAEALAGTEWILHAATQDLGCLAEIGLVPTALFDTELAGRLLGKPRVGLATLVEEILGQRLRKEHSAADWSTRPLPESWLEYAALDVEVLLELREVLLAELDVAGKGEWAEQEFAALLDFKPVIREEPWRRTSGAHRLRGGRAQAAVRELWQTRDRIAKENDTAPGRIIPDSAIVAASDAMPTTRHALLAVTGFHGRGAGRYAKDWLAAIRTAREMPDSALPGRLKRGDGPPQPRMWADRDPVAARRLGHARPAMAELAERLDVPTENLLTPDYFRRVLWAPPVTRDRDSLPAAIADQLRALGARPWQIELTAPILVDAVMAADKPAAT